MTEIDYLKCKLEDTEKALDKLHKRHIELLKQQGELEKENEMLKEENEQLKKENRMLKKDLNKLYNLLMGKGMSHNELQDVLWRIDDG